jgi:hypothetical protein
LSRHNITGSEAFDKRPFVIIRGMKPGNFRRRRARNGVILAVVGLLALTAGALGGAAAVDAMKAAPAPSSMS